MKNENTKKISNRSRVALTESNTNTVQQWYRQISKEFAGIKISESDLVNWAIESVGGELSKRQLEEIKNKYFDEVKQLEWMLAQARAARANHDHETLSKLVVSLRRPLRREKSSPEQALDSPLTSDSQSPLIS